MAAAAPFRPTFDALLAPTSGAVGQQPLGHQALAQGMAGDAASPAAIGKLSRSLAGGGRLKFKAQKKVVEKLRAALAAIRLADFDGGARRALEALQLDEQSGLAWHVLAICREKSGDLAQALSAYEAALKLLPAETDVAHDLGRLAQRLGQLEIAEKLLLKYLTAQPGNIEATNNLACVYRDQRRYGDAIELLRAMIAVEPESPILWNTLGTVLSDQGEMRQSVTFFDEALRLDADFAKARYNRGNARQVLGDAEAALADLDIAFAGAESGYETAMMTMARALLMLSVGRLKEGFETYEIRLDPEMPEAMHVVANGPRWDPATLDIRGKRLLVVGEQGIADEMVFGTTLPDVIEALGPEGELFLAVEPRLVDLYQRTFPTAMVGGHRAVQLEGRLTRYMPFMDEIAFDAWAPMASLLALYRQSIDQFPDREGYLTPDPVKVARWRAELDQLGPGLKVGLHWKSLILKGVRARYFSSFDRWKPVLTTPGCVMVNLQCGDTTEDLAQAEAAGVRIWTPPMDLKDDLDDLAALSRVLDVVIGPGIAGTNIAAAVGARTWLIHAPDDWHLLATDGYPFYPRTRTFATGGFNGWPVAISQVRAALEQAVAGDWNGL